MIGIETAFRDKQTWIKSPIVILLVILEMITESEGGID